MSEPNALIELRRRRLLAVIRAPSVDAARRGAEAVARGGIPILEITFTVPDAPKVIATLAQRDDLVVGAGTVLNARQCRAALAAGARFIVAPNRSTEVARTALDAGVLYCPGAYTTSEIIAAYNTGAQLIKVYPVGVAGGPPYIRVIRDPLPYIPMLAAGGTTLDNVVPFLEAGCDAVGLGASLCDPALAAASAWDEIERRARAFVARVGTLEAAPDTPPSPAPPADRPAPERA